MIAVSAAAFGERGHTTAHMVHGERGHVVNVATLLRDSRGAW
jgi:hypothetical protein